MDGYRYTSHICKTYGFASIDVYCCVKVPMCMERKHSSRTFTTTADVAMNHGGA